MAIPTGLFGNYNLNAATIDANVDAKIGAYALGNKILPDDSLQVLRVGRSDDNLNKRLKDYLGSYNYFQYGHFDTKTKAYYKECELYHAFSPTDNEIHPDKPKGLNVSCPNCGA